MKNCDLSHGALTYILDIVSLMYFTYSGLLSNPKHLVRNQLTFSSSIKSDPLHWKSLAVSSSLLPQRPLVLPLKYKYNIVKKNQ